MKDNINHLKKSWTLQLKYTMRRLNVSRLLNGDKTA
jgi:hypothetical protein